MNRRSHSPLLPRVSPRPPPHLLSMDVLFTDVTLSPWHNRRRTIARGEDDRANSTRRMRGSIRW